MNLRHATRSLALSALILSTSAAATSIATSSRGGETGTLGEKDPILTTTGDFYWPYYIRWDQYRRLRARLGGQNPFAPIPGWESRRAWLWNDRLFSEDGRFEIMPLEQPPQR